MSKSILIIETPKNCAECKVVDYWPKVQEYHCRYLENRYLKKYDEKPVDCPLRPVPKKMDARKNDNLVVSIGWNACLSEILREEEK